MVAADSIDRLGPYILRENLGQGPAGAVYRATECETGRECALKIVTLRQDGEEDSLLRDLRATNDIHVASTLRHPGIVRVHRVDAIAECSATEMEYIRGMSLRDLLGIAGYLLPERAVAIVYQILDALAYAHARQAVHGNLKPTNILIRCDGLTKVSDFGFRKAHPDPKSVRAAPIHCYAAPEELEPEVKADRRSDIWSVGVLLYQMLTGRLPFRISDPHDLRAWQRGLKANTALPLSECLPEAPEALQTAVARSLQYDPSERFANAREFLNTLLDSGLCAGMIDSEDEHHERLEATYRRIDNHLRAEVDANEQTSLPDIVRAFSETNPHWEDNANLLHYAGLLDRSDQQPDEPEPHAIALSPDEVDHLEEIETRLKSLLSQDENIADTASEPAFDTLPRLGSNERDRRDRDWDLESTSRKVSAPPSRPESPTRNEPLFNPADGAELVSIPAGDFTMGSNGFSEDNTPQHAVALDGYCIYRYLVTVAQYRRYCEETAYPMPRAFWPWEEMDPIVGVTWNEAAAYSAWAAAQLPTEAQWEKAARGVDGRAFPWGDHFEQRSDHRLVPRNAGKTTAVGSYPSGCSPYGLMDVVGNVQQWCLDLYDDEYYKTGPSRNPVGPSTSVKRRPTKSGLVQKLFNKRMQQPSIATEQRVVRGSSWKDHHESFAYTFRRDTFSPDMRLPWVGFRCVADMIPPQRK